MRLYVGAAVLVAVVVGGAWLVLALTFSASPSGNADAFTRSATCVRGDPALVSDRVDAARFRVSGLQPLGIRWKQVRAVALFDDSLSAHSVTKEEALIASRLRRQGVSSAEIADRLQYEDNVALLYVSGTPSQTAEAAIGTCVYLIHFNRIASFFGLYVSPHARRPFLPGARREDRF